MDLDPSIVWDFAGEVVGTLRPASRAVPATVTRIDADGTVWATVGDGMEAPAASSSVGLSVGDEVSVQWSGNAMSVVGNTSSPAPSGRAFRAVERVARAARELARDAQAVAAATGQYFWHDANGAHVSNEKGNATAAQNTVWNSLGMLFRKGANNVLAIVTGTDPGMDVYDGQGNADGNVIASYRGSGSRIGRASEVHVEVAPDAMSVVNGGESVAHFGEDARIGAEDSPHLTMDETDGVVFWNGQTRLSGFDASGYNYGWRDDLNQPIVRTNVYDNTDVGYPFGAITVAGSTEAFTDSELGWECERALSTDGKYVRAQLHVESEGANSGPAVTARVRHGDVDGTLKLECFQIETSGPVIDLYAAIDTVTLYDRKSGAYSQAFPTHGVVNGNQSTATPANGYHDFTVDFDHTYTSPPHVVVGFYSTSTASQLGGMSCAAHSITKAGCKIRVFNGTSSDRSPGVEWFAIG